MRHLSFAVVTLALLSTGCSSGSGGGGGGGATPLCAATPGTNPVTVSGAVRYEDIGYSSAGWTGNNLYKPVRHAIVDLLDSCGNLLTSDATDGSGAFLFSNVTTTAAPLTVRVLAESDPASGGSVAIRSLGGAGYAATYSLAGVNLATAQSIDIAKASGLGGVFNMLDIYQSALEFAASHAAAPSLPQLNVYWKNTLGSYTCSGYDATACPKGMGIYVYSVSSDQDEYDDDVLWHEFAHFVEYAIAASDSPGGSHTFVDNTLDLRLAWSEGHADYLQTAIKRWLRINHPERLSIPPAPFPVSWYVDTDTAGGILIKLDMANPGGTPYLYATNEVAVANALWHGSEAHSEPPFWDAFASHLPTVNDGLPLVKDNLRNLEAYWDGLLLQLTPLGVTESSALSSFAARSINYAADAYEPDDTVGDRTTINCSTVAVGAVCVNESHTLYRGSGISDSDVVPITVTSGRSYTFATAPMVNGLDSYLELFAQDGTTLLKDNDDLLTNCDYTPNNGIPDCINNGSYYASGLTYTPSYSGTLYVRVTAVPYYVSDTFYRGLGAGIYGGYTLTVTAN